MARFEDAPHMSDDSCERGRHDDRGRGHDDCDGVWLELVLRDVDVTLSEAEVAAAGDFCAVALERGCGRMRSTPTDAPGSSVGEERKGARGAKQAEPR